MTEWNASEYNRRSALQKWLADKSLAGLDLRGSERVLDVGCGDGKITAEIAERLPGGSVVGVDSSTRMIEFAREHFVADHANLGFAVADAVCLFYRDAFDLVRLVQCAPLGSGPGSGASVHPRCDAPHGPFPPAAGVERRAEVTRRRHRRDVR
jgi:trans-aconitate methyltransferase